jgi:hypothetical protein
LLWDIAWIQPRVYSPGTLLAVLPANKTQDRVIVREVAIQGVSERPATQPRSTTPDQALVE